VRAQGESPGVADQPGRHPDEAVPQGGDHGLALAEAVTGQRAVGAGGAAVAAVAAVAASSAPHIHAVLMSR
jgi:hypothetical protein